MPEFCSVQDINDLLGKKIEASPVEYYIKSGGTLEPEMVVRLIEKRSGIINGEHQMNYNKTKVIDEYYDTDGIPKLILNNHPILSIESLGIWNGSEYATKTEGNNRNTDDYFIEKSGSGFVGFWSTPPAGKRYIKISYTYGYETIPEYVKECCIKMVGIDIIVSPQFVKACTEEYKKWEALAKIWAESIDFILNTFIRIQPISVKSIGLYNSPGFEAQLENATGDFDD